MYENSKRSLYFCKNIHRYRCKQKDKFMKFHGGEEKQKHYGSCVNNRKVVSKLCH